jgi:hypothetical protein
MNFNPGYYDYLFNEMEKFCDDNSTNPSFLKGQEDARLFYEEFTRGRITEFIPCYDGLDKEIYNRSFSYMMDDLMNDEFYNKYGLSEECREESCQSGGAAYDSSVATTEIVTVFRFYQRQKPKVYVIELESNLPDLDFIPGSGRI